MNIRDCGSQVNTKKTTHIDDFSVKKLDENYFQVVTCVRYKVAFNKIDNYITKI